MHLFLYLALEKSLLSLSYIYLSDFANITYWKDVFQRPRSGVATRGVTPRLRPGAVGGRSYPTPEARGGGREDQTHVQGAMAMRAQEGLEELSHVEGQEGQRWGDTPCPR